MAINATLAGLSAGLSSRLDFTAWLEETGRLLKLQTAPPALSLLADQSVTIVSAGDEIRISAQSKIELIAGQSGIKLDDGELAGVAQGVLDGNGYARHDGVPNEAARVFFGDSLQTATPATVQARAVTEDDLAADLHTLGLDPQAVDLQTLVEHQAGRSA